MTAPTEVAEIYSPIAALISKCHLSRPEFQEGVMKALEAHLNPNHDPAVVRDCASDLYDRSRTFSVFAEQLQRPPATKPFNAAVLRMAEVNTTFLTLDSQTKPESESSTPHLIRSATILQNKLPEVAERIVNERRTPPRRDALPV